jgi:hypothetical protein
MVEWLREVRELQNWFDSHLLRFFLHKWNCCVSDNTIATTPYIVDIFIFICLLFTVMLVFIFCYWVPVSTEPYFRR